MLADWDAIPLPQMQQNTSSGGNNKRKYQDSQVRREDPAAGKPKQRTKNHRRSGPNADCLPPHLQELDPDCEVVGVVTAADREHAARVAAVVLDGSDDTTSIG